MADDNSWLIDIPSQGIKVSSRGKDEILKFFQDEIGYFSNLAVNGHSVTFGNSGYGTVSLTQPAVEQLSVIVNEINKDKIQALNQYVEDANSFQILVGASPMGKRIAQLKATDTNAAALAACILAPKWQAVSQHSAGQIISLFRSIAFANPANFGFDNLVSASATNRASQEALERSRTSVQELEKFIAEKTALFNTLEDLYRKQLTVQEPAISWETIARRKTRVWGSWLLVFALLVITPILTAFLFWEQVSGAVVKVTSVSNGGFSISGLAVITVPALFYAWLLKNISRVFIQNLNLADDAAHRRSLALTYMGLLQDEKHPASDQDRAIILNALFRPIPPQTSDEGPPAGLIDLIQKK